MEYYNCEIVIITQFLTSLLIDLCLLAFCYSSVLFVSVVVDVSVAIDVSFSWYI